MVAPDGSQVGVKSIQEAMWLADQLGLDLVEVAPTAKPPVARLMDYGKYKYEQSVKESEARRKQSKSTVKEITFRVKIGDHDFQIKSDRAKRFLENGDKVRARIWFRGREASRPQLGMRILDRLTDDLVDIGKVDQEPRQEGRNMTMTFSPVKRTARRSAQQASDVVPDPSVPAVEASDATETDGTALEVVAAEELEDESELEAPDAEDEDA